jgi:hypothetical protein
LAGKRDTIDQVRYWEIIADNLSKAGWSWGCVSAIDSNGRTIWIADAHRDDGKRFVVRADEKLTAFCGTGGGGSSRHFIKSKPNQHARSAVGCIVWLDVIGHQTN